jgi:hypothetical protein
MAFKTPPMLIVRFAVAASVLLNVGLLGLLLSRSYPEQERANAQVLAVSSASPSSEPDGYAGYKPYYETLLSRGLSPQEAKWLLMARLEREAVQRATLPARAYWGARDTSQLQVPLKLLAERDKVRTALVEVFGADAWGDPMFSSLFQPLGVQFSFLAPAQQIAVQRLKLERQVSAAMMSVTLSSFPQPQQASTNQSPANAPSGWSDFDSKLAAVLDSRGLLEYRLRDSPLAEQLRGTEVGFSEEEFRATFAILTRMDDDGKADPEVYATSRRELRALLGGRRFAVLWESRDPLFAVTKQACEKHSLPEATVVMVYELFNDSQDRVIEITRAAKDNPQRGAENVREERAELGRRLSTLVGDEVAQDILRAQTRQILSLTNSQQFVPR